MGDEDIIEWVEWNCAAGRPAHILTSEPEAAERIAQVVARRAEAPQAVLVTLETVTFPTASVAVGTAAAMCFAYLRAKVRGEAHSIVAEDLLRRTAALVVGVSAEERLYPCQIVDCSGPADRGKHTVLAALALPEFFAKYALVHDLGLGAGATLRPTCS
ncbi:MAG: hypothetical protein FJ290_20285 [Planctomycetes bacterium]|nr:hypothetical protein [Planctomycetota bacterium]